MSELRRFSVTSRRELPAVRLAELASRQGGVVSSAQLQAIGISEPTIRRWRAKGWLHRVHPRVFAVGHRAIGIAGRLYAALLYAGDCSALSHQTAGWKHGIIRTCPETIHVSEPGRRRDVRGVLIHHPRQVIFERIDGFRITRLPGTLLDLAWVLDFSDLRRALAEADYKGKLDPVAVYAQLGRGRRGSTALRQAMSLHLPELAATFSILEERFLALISEAGLPLPEVNVRVAGLLVDCLWRDVGLIVELDGHKTHARNAAIENDRRREMVLRRAGFRVIRYTWQQVTQTPGLVIAELRGELLGR